MKCMSTFIVTLNKSHDIPIGTLFEMLLSREFSVYTVFPLSEEKFRVVCKEKKDAEKLYATLDFLSVSLRLSEIQEVQL